MLKYISRGTEKYIVFLWFSALKISYINRPTTGPDWYMN